MGWDVASVYQQSFPPPNRHSCAGRNLRSGGWDAANSHDAIVIRPDRSLKRRHRCAAPTPLLVSPLEGGRDELGVATRRLSLA